jgi:hypothetical protein
MVLDHDRLAPRRREGGADDAGEIIDRSAGREGHDDAHRPAGKILRQRAVLLRN